MRKATIKILSLLIVSSTLFSCKSDIFNSKLNEGIVMYDVDYPMMDSHNVMADFMPDEMSMEFKDNVFKTELSAGMGMFKTNFISNCNDPHRMDHLVKLVNKKYLTHYDDNSVAELNDIYEDFTMVTSDDTKEICGYICKKVWIIFTDVSMPSFELYYTDEIDIENANWSIPYAVDGVMLDYIMKRNGIVMHLTATSVKKSEVDESIFEIPDDYTPISIEEMDNELNSLFETFDY